MPISLREPWRDEYDQNDDHFLEVYEGLLSKAVIKAGFNPLRPITEGSDIITNDIIKKIMTSEMVLCDISTTNANVLYELGVRTGANKPVALVSDTHDGLPFDIQAISIKLYNKSLRSTIVEGDIEKIASHILETYKGSDDGNPVLRSASFLPSQLQAMSENKSKTSAQPLFASLVVGQNKLETTLGSLIREWEVFNGQSATYEFTGRVQSYVSSYLLAANVDFRSIFHDNSQKITILFETEQVLHASLKYFFRTACDTLRVTFLVYHGNGEEAGFRPV